MGRQKSSSAIVSTNKGQKRKKNHEKIVSDDRNCVEETEIEDEHEHGRDTIKPTKRLMRQEMAPCLDAQEKESNPPSETMNQQAPTEISRPKRKATNSHFFRYLQTRNPSRLEEEDLRRALEASLEECPDYWPEDSASCSSSDHSNPPSSSSGSSTGIGGDPTGHCNGRNCRHNRLKRRRGSSQPCCSRSQFCPYATMQHNHNHSNQSNNNCQTNQNSFSNNNHPATNCHTNNCSSHSAISTSSLIAHQCCPNATFHRRYKPVAKKNIYDDADFFHDGIMEYIEYELLKHHGIIAT